MSTIKHILEIPQIAFSDRGTYWQSETIWHPALVMESFPKIKLWKDRPVYEAYCIFIKYVNEEPVEHDFCSFEQIAIEQGNPLVDNCKVYFYNKIKNDIEKHKNNIISSDGYGVSKQALKHFEQYDMPHGVKVKFQFKLDFEAKNNRFNGNVDDSTDLLFSVMCEMEGVKYADEFFDKHLRKAA